MDFIEKLNHLMERDGLNKNTLSAKSGVPYTTIDAFYKKGYNNVKLTTLRKIASAFDVTLDYLMLDNIGDENYGKADGFAVDYHEMQCIKKYRMLDERGKKAIDTLLDFELSQVSAAPEPATVEMIVYTYPAAAGVPLYADDDYEQMEFPESSVPKGANFGIRISGDSMEPTIQDGAIVWVRKCPELQNGQIGVFMMDDTSVCKRYYKKGKTVELHSDNPAYEPIIIKDYERFGIIGKVLEYR